MIGAPFSGGSTTGLSSIFLESRGRHSGKPERKNVLRVLCAEPKGSVFGLREIPPHPIRRDFVVWLWFLPPALLERRHRGLARRRVTVCGCSPVLMSVGHCPRPRRSNGRCDRLEYVPNDGAVLADHVVVVQAVGAGPNL